MTRDEITRMAQEARLIKAGDGWTEPHRWGLSELVHFAALVAAAEREACAKVCENGVDTEHPTVKGHIMKDFGQSTLLAKAIRARGDK